MNFFSEFWHYILGSIVFFGLAHVWVLFFNKTFVENISEFFSNSVIAYNKKNKPKNDDKKLKDRDKEIQQELENEVAIENQVDNFVNQDPNLEVMDSSIEKPIKKSKKSKIIGLADVKDVVKGEFSKRLAQETINNLRQMDIKSVQDKGVNQARYEAEKSAKSKGAVKKQGRSL